MAETNADLERRMKELETELQALKAAKPQRRRVTFEFSEETYQQLRQEAEQKRTSMADIVRDALSRTRWLEETVEKGRLFVREEDDGEIYVVKRI